MPESHTDTTESSSTLEKTDELARQVVCRAAPIRLDVARTAAERDEVYRLRYRAVIDRRWARPEDFPDGMERDAYDDVAVNVIAWDDSTLAASARLVFPGPGYQLPTEEIFGVVVEPRGQVVDMGRQIVARTHSDAQHRIFAALLGRCWLEARSRGFFYLCGDFTSSMIRLYRMMRFQIEVLGRSRSFFGEERFPILCDPGRDIALLLERWGSERSGGA